MERDFLGLNSREASPLVQKETLDGSNDHVFMRRPGMQWLFSKKVSALPHFTPFKTAQEEKPKKIMLHSVTPSTFHPVNTASIYESSHKSSGISQAYPFHPVDTHSSHEIRSLPVANHSVSVPMINPSLKIHGASDGLNDMTTNPRNQLRCGLGGIVVTNPQQHSVRTMGSMAGTYTSCSPSKSATASAQLTIFYAGSVNVFNDISPEKAQAIMLLAGSGSALNANLTDSTSLMQALAPKCNATPSGSINKTHSQSFSPSSRLSSPTSVTSHVGLQSHVVSSNADELMVTKIVRSLSHRSQPEPHDIVSSIGTSAQPDSHRVISSIGSVAETSVPTVPQTRKASLARFLEKRKERVINAAPYDCKKSIKDGPGAG